MVDLNDPKSPESFKVDVQFLLVPGIILAALVGQCLDVNNLFFSTSQTFNSYSICFTDYFETNQVTWFFLNTSMYKYISIILNDL